MDSSKNNGTYDGLLFARSLGNGGKDLARKVRRLIDLRSRKSDFNNALTAVHSATRFLQEAEAENRGGEHNEYVRSTLRALNAQAVVLYCRGSDPKGGRIPLPLHNWLLTPDEVEKHRNIMNVRNRVIAHHVQTKADIGGPWLNERMYFLQDERGWGVGVLLERFDFKSATTCEILEMATKAVERIETMDVEALADVAAELGQLLRDRDNVRALERSKFAVPDAAGEIGQTKTTYAFKTYPEKGSPFQKRKGP